MIVGTAGHIDHGKTALIRALTGVETDRLKEEKERGITIELGYAVLRSSELNNPNTPSSTSAQDLSVSFIDVPGHEKLVHTMVSGASSIDYALLVIAADDGVMPQTLEHLSILKLLNIAAGVVVLSKIDLVDQALLAQREQEITELLRRFGLAQFGLHRVSTKTAQGIEGLRAKILQDASERLKFLRNLEESQEHGPVRGLVQGLVQSGSLPALNPFTATPTSLSTAPSISLSTEPLGTPTFATHLTPTLSFATFGFRMGLDRVFTLAGVGCVVAGTAVQGEVSVGDSLCLANEPTKLYKVKSIQVHSAQVERATRGQRCAIVLAGLKREDAQRGQILCSPSIVTISERFDAYVETSLEHDKDLTFASGVHVHCCTQEVTASVSLLQETPIAPGESGLVQVILNKPLHLWIGDKIIIRDASATRTLAGGYVLDPRAPKRYRKTPERVAYLRSLTPSQSSPSVRSEDSTTPVSERDYVRGDVREYFSRPSLGAARTLLLSTLEHAAYGILILERFKEFGLVCSDTRESLAELVSSLNADKHENQESYENYDKYESHGDNPTQLPTAHLSTNATWLISQERLGQLSERVRSFVADFHAQHPDSLGPSLHRVQRTFGKAMVDQIWAELLTYLEARGLVGRKSGFLFIPSHHQSLKSSDEQVAQKVYPLILEGRFDPPWVRDLATQTGSGELQMRLSLQRLASAGELYQVVKDLFYHPSVIQELAKIAISIAQTQAPGEPLSKARITAAQFRDATGLGRKRAIQILEFFDKIGFTRRIEDTHLIRGNTGFFK